MYSFIYIQTLDKINQFILHTPDDVDGDDGDNIDEYRLLYQAMTIVIDQQPCNRCASVLTR